MLFASFVHGRLPYHTFSVQQRFITSAQSKVFRLGHKPIRNFLKIHDATLNRFGPRLAWVLRHAAPSLGIYMRPDGYALAEDVLRAVPFGRMTVDDLVATSKMDPEARTQVKKLRAKQWWIRAAGKHSIDFVSTGWKEIEQPHELDQIVYLTESSEWESIRYRGLKRAQNEYFIRLRQNIPENFGYSGEGRSAAIVIYIDIQNAMEQGLTFFVNRDNEVILDVDCIPPMFFQKVERVRWSKDILLGSSANDEAQSLT